MGLHKPNLVDLAEREGLGGLERLVGKIKSIKLFFVGFKKENSIN